MRRYFGAQPVAVVEEIEWVGSTFRWSATEKFAGGALTAEDAKWRADNVLEGLGFKLLTAPKGYIKEES